MSKRPKGSNNNRKVPNQQSVAPKQEQKTKVTIDDVATSKNEPEFEKNKDKLIQQLVKEVENWELEKRAAEDAASNSKRLYEKLEIEINGLKTQREELQKEYDALKVERNAAVDFIEKANAKAEREAKEIIDAAGKERMEMLTISSNEAREAWNAKIENLNNQFDDISSREMALYDLQIKLQQERHDIDIEKEELEELNTYLQKLKERYNAANPERIEELELDLGDEQKKYRTLLEKYEKLSEKLKDAQVLLDTIKIEIEDSTGGKKVATMQEIVTTMQEFRDRYEKLVATYNKYPDDECISALESKAQKVDKLERENDTLEQERNRYREEAVAARNASKELEVIRQEVEATNALNEHLLRELESHKTALESRTGDTCPALSKVDTETEETDFGNDIKQRIQRAQITSLRELVLHVKNYAGSRKKEEQLFYSENDIRAFLAGMAISRLIILQGMSGTGKSSLPRIFSEAISGFNRLIPVESSWRDRNELLGYYNDFNKKFNAKTFTIELYRSSKRRCQQIPTFIVLDEMNLARIEYYFSDFLAILQEPDHDKWLIELVSSDMRTLPMELPEEVKQKMKKDEPTVFAIWEKLERSRLGCVGNEASDEEKEALTIYLSSLGRLTGAKDLIAGRKIKVTDNIWFVGTANRDESTFEISDKVYDRAQVVSLSRRGVSEGKYQPTDTKYISVVDLQTLFESAISAYENKKEVEARLEALDTVLIEKFDVSFGNRIVTQTVDFVAVFVTAGGKLEDALDYQISTKILRKVISSDNYEAFLELLDATAGYPETQHLIEKRMKDLR